MYVYVHDLFEWLLSTVGLEQIPVRQSHVFQPNRSVKAQRAPGVPTSAVPVPVLFKVGEKVTAYCGDLEEAFPAVIKRVNAVQPLYGIQVRDRIIWSPRDELIYIAGPEVQDKDVKSECEEDVCLWWEGPEYEPWYQPTDRDVVFHQ